MGIKGCLSSLFIILKTVDINKLYKLYINNVKAIDILTFFDYDFIENILSIRLWYVDIKRFANRKNSHS